MAEERSSWWSKLQMYTIVTVITALIWLYAESENVKPYDPMPIGVQFVAPPGQNLVVDPASPQQVTIQVRCATSQYAALERLIRQGPVPLPVEEDPGRPLQVLVLRDRLAASPIGGLGVHIEGVRPETVEVYVEASRDVQMPVSPDALVPPDVQLAVPPMIDPPAATVRMPVSVAREVGDLRLEASLDPATLNGLAENVPHDVNVPLRLPQALRDRLRTPGAATITPSQVRATIAIRKKTDTLKLTSVPILLLGPWSELNRVSIAVESDQRVVSEEVRLTGPADVIDRIRKGEIKVWAELQLTADELESGITSKQLHIRVPAGVTVDSPIPQVNFTIAPSGGARPPAAAAP